MQRTPSLIRTLAASALLATTAAQANMVMYTDQAAFNAALFQTGSDFFQGLALGSQNVPNLNRQTVGGQFGYTVSSQLNGGPDTLYGAGTTTDRWISTNSSAASLFLTGFTPGVKAVAVFGVTSAADFSPAPGFDISVSACPMDVNASCIADTYFTTIGDSDFRGFISSDGVRFVSVSSTSIRAFPSISEVQIGTVPEPTPLALILGSLVGMGLLARRRAG